MGLLEKSKRLLPMEDRFLAAAQRVFAIGAGDSGASSPLWMETLNQAFDPKTIRLALTATPDYGDHRRLDLFFPRCILLMDLAPTLSIVRATQKYFRVMTRHKVTEARIVVILPSDIPRPPVPPIDLLLMPGQTYDCGSFINSPNHTRKAKRAALDGPLKTPVQSVRLKSRLIACAQLVKPSLAPRDQEQIRRVLESCPEFSPCMSFVKRIGLYGEAECTWSEIAEDLKVSVERARQIYLKAIKVLRKKHKIHSRFDPPLVMSCEEHPDFAPIA